MSSPSKNVPGNVPGNAPPNAPGNAPGNARENAPGNTSENAPENAPVEASGNERQETVAESGQMLVAASADRPWRGLLQHLTVFVVFIAVWEIAVQRSWVSPLILPSPFAVVAAWWDLAIVRGLIWKHFFVTLGEVLAGFTIGSLFGCGIAVLSAINQTFRRLVSPYMVALQVTPRIAIAPIIVAWLGFNMEPKIAIAAIICFFPIFINTLTGLMQVDEDRMEMFQSMRASRWQIFRHLQLPGAMPVIMAGFKTGISLALIGAIVGEFVSASVGMGVLIQRFSYQLLLPEAFACLLMLTVMGLLLYGIASFADKRVVFWQHDALMTRISHRMKRRHAAILIPTKAAQTA